MGHAYITDIYYQYHSNGELKNAKYVDKNNGATNRGFDSKGRLIFENRYDSNGEVADETEVIYEDKKIIYRHNKSGRDNIIYLVKNENGEIFRVETEYVDHETGKHWQNDSSIYNISIVRNVK